MKDVIEKIEKLIAKENEYLEDAMRNKNYAAGRIHREKIASLRECQNMIPEESPITPSPSPVTERIGSNITSEKLQEMSNNLSESLAKETPESIEAFLEEHKGERSNDIGSPSPVTWEELETSYDERMKETITKYSPMFSMNDTRIMGMVVADVFKFIKERYPLHPPMEWYSPDTAEVGEYVLVIVGTDTVLKGRLMNNGWTAMFADGEKLVGDVRPVTGWQPLPPSPQK